MTNDDLWLKIIDDLGLDYQIGLHHATKDAYIWKARFNNDKYNMDENCVTENDIVVNILKNGLYVPECCVGLKSTVMFLDKVTPNSFNYSYYCNGTDKCYIIVVAIPNYIYIDGNKYFIGDMTEYISIANFSLFHELLPKEFIYGYYVKKIANKTGIKNGVFFYNDYVFDDEFRFYSNDNFYGYMSEEEKEKFWTNYLEDNELNSTILDMANYPNLSNMLFQNGINRYLVRRKSKQLLAKKCK